MSYHSNRFGRAAKTYNAHCEAQVIMSKTLMGLLSDSAPLFEVGENGILELGCGTGILTRPMLQEFPRSSLLATDASDQMLIEAVKNFGPTRVLNPKLKFQVLDASGNDDVIPSNPLKTTFDLAASNALVQWFPDLTRHFKWVSKRLESHGGYLVSGFSRDNFPELNILLSEPPFNYSAFPGHRKEEVSSAAQAAGFHLESWTEESLEAIFPSPEAFLAAISGLGSSRRPSEASLTRTRLIYLVDAYRERYSCEGGVKATWKPWYAFLRVAR